MAVRVVEWKKPYTGGKAIEIDENKVISLRLRDENNLIIRDEWDNEIYVDLQLDDEIRPTDAFPVWVTTGRVIVDNWWDITWTVLVFKTTSWDNVKLLYGDNWKLYIDNWTWTFKQIYLKGEVDALLQALRTYVDEQLALKQDKLIAWENITINADGKTINAILPPLSRFLSLWDCETWLPISFPTSDLPFEYVTWDHYLVSNVDSTTNYRPNWTEFDGTASSTVETADVQEWDLYIYDGNVWLLQINHDKSVTFANIAWQPTDNNALAQALGAKQDTLVNQTNIKSINGNSLLGSWDLTIQAWVTSVNWNTWAVTVNEVPSWWTNGQVLTQTQNWPAWQNATGGSTIEYVTQAEYTALLPWAASDWKHYFIYSTSGGWGWQPWANTIFYFPLSEDMLDHSGNSVSASGWWTITYQWWAGALISSKITINYSTQPTDFTALCYMKNTTSSDIIIAYSNLQSSWWFKWWDIATNVYNSWQPNSIRVESLWSSPTWKEAFNATTTNWNLVAFVKDGTNNMGYFYINGILAGSQSLVWTASTWNYSLSDGSMYLWDVILESKCWTAQEISDYFNWTKANYGIS